jgi:hypothetical protein
VNGASALVLKPRGASPILEPAVFPQRLGRVARPAKGLQVSLVIKQGQVAAMRDYMVGYPCRIAATDAIGIGFQKLP